MIKTLFFHSGDLPGGRCWRSSLIYCDSQLTLHAFAKRRKQEIFISSSFWLVDRKTSRTKAFWSGFSQHGPSVSWLCLGQRLSNTDSIHMLPTQDENCKWNMESICNDILLLRYVYKHPQHTHQRPKPKLTIASTTIFWGPKFSSNTSKKWGINTPNWHPNWQESAPGISSII